MKKINIFLITVISILILIVIFIDNDTLNSLLINYDNITINEIAVLNVDYNKVIYNEEIIAKQAAERKYLESQKNNNTVNLVNKTVTTNGWTWPTDNNYTITTYYSSSHQAIDIYSYSGNGSGIYAANNGTVSMVKGGCRVGNLSCNGSGGNYVVINHNNGYYTVYMHLKTINVSTGQNVSAGQVIGTMGNTGNVIPVPTASAPYLGTHLHFSVYKGEPFKGGKTINPMNLY